MNKILFFSRDPGGANCIISVVEYVATKKEYTVALFGKDSACQCYAKKNMSYQDLNKVIEGKVTPESIRKLVDEINPVCIVTGTSEDDMTEKYLWRAAQEAEIPSLAILDYWNSYRLRFSYALDTLHVAGLSKYCLPNKICIMDDFAKNEMLSEGFPSDSLEITGQPYLSSVRQRLSRNKDSGNYRKRLGISPDCRLIVVISEAVCSMYGDQGRVFWGYDEITLLQNIFEALCGMRQKTLQEKFCIVIRLHPKDKEHILDDALAAMKSDFIKIVKERDASVDDLISGADMFIGASSMLLLEAAVTQKPFLSVQIGQKQHDPFILSRMQQVKRVMSADDLKIRLTEFFSDGRFDRVDFPYVENAVENIEKTILRLIGEYHGNVGSSRR